jgi:hypothetical protein
MDIDSNWVLLIPVVLIVAVTLQVLAMYGAYRLIRYGFRRFANRGANPL